MFKLIYPLIFLLLSCNGNPEYLNSKPIRKKKSNFFEKFKPQYKISTFHITSTKTSKKKLSLLFMPTIKRVIEKNIKGVIYIKGEQVERNLKFLELANSSSSSGCKIEWKIFIWEDKNHNIMDIMPSCDKFAYKGKIYELKGTAKKVINTFITKQRIQPNRKLAILNVPVVHIPNTINKLIENFVETTVPYDYNKKRLPSFKVFTEHYAPMPRDLSKTDLEVKNLRNRLKFRLNTFTGKIKKKASQLIWKITKPYRIKEKFTSELYARWGLTVYCKMGTSTDQMYAMSINKKVWIYKINIPLYYKYFVVQFPKTHRGPTLYEKISSLSIDPPITLK